MSKSNAVNIEIVIDDLKQVSKRLGQLETKFKGTSSNISEGMGKANKSLNKIGESVNGLSGKFAKLGAAWMGVSAAIGTFKQITAGVVDFDSKMREANTLLKLTGDELNEIDNLSTSFINKKTPSFDGALDVARRRIPARLLMQSFRRGTPVTRMKTLLSVIIIKKPHLSTGLWM